MTICAYDKNNTAVTQEVYDALEARLAEAERDAARNRWLCEYRAWPEPVEAAFDCGSKALIDAEIDAAMATTDTSSVVQP